MNALRKLSGLLVFVAALAGAFALSSYFSAPPAPAEPSPPPPLVRPESPRAADAAPPAAVTFKPRLVLLDFNAGKSYLTLELEQNPDGPAPERLWVWADFFSAEGVLRTRCEGEAAEVRQPFVRGRRATVVVEMPARGCVSPKSPAATFYARVNVSTESAAAAARPPGDRDAFDITKATPVVTQGARLWRQSDAKRWSEADASRRYVPRSER
ncbi:MAG TPA: hypothetical protein VN228_01360 [Pyrinomonadaceae bacterium]|nr:hypothetical protein [Pyrinomonadaceae bacterium]